MFRLEKIHVAYLVNLIHWDSLWIQFMRLNRVSKDTTKLFSNTIMLVYMLLRQSKLTQLGSPTSPPVFISTSHHMIIKNWVGSWIASKKLTVFPLYMNAAKKTNLQKLIYDLYLYYVVVYIIIGLNHTHIVCALLQHFPKDKMLTFLKLV